jgi:hypothetical protein
MQRRIWARRGDRSPGEGAGAGDVESCGRPVNTGSWRVPARLLAEQAPRRSTAATDRPQVASSNLLSASVLGTESTDFVEDLVGLEAEAAADDLFLDLGGAAEVLPSQRCNRMPSATGIDAGAADDLLARQLRWVADSLSAIAGG